MSAHTCTWCEANESCLQKNPKDVFNALSCPDKFLASNMSSCIQESVNHRGITLFQYKFPANWSHPDSVKILNTSTFTISRGENVNPNQPPVIFSLQGFLVDSSIPLEKLEFCVYHVQANLTMEQGPVNDKEQLALFMEWARTDTSCSNLTWSSGLPVSLLPGAKISVDINASMSELYQSEKYGRVSLKHNLKLFKKEHLLPYSSNGQNCLEAKTCMKCTGDSSCIWYNDLNSCGSRVEWLKSGWEVNGKHKVTLLSRDCSTCSEFVTCSECTRGRDCEWFEGDAICLRKGRSKGSTDVVVDPAVCPTECHLRKSCSTCLGHGVSGPCVWCASTNECFVFSLYTSFYQFGGCLRWKDKYNQCNECGSQSNCEDCISRGMNCGWNYKKGGEGSCIEGDFAGPYDLIQNTKGASDELTWTYDVCPDVDECSLDLHECHPNAECKNTPGSYSCQCKNKNKESHVLD